MGFLESQLTPSSWSQNRTVWFAFVAATLFYGVGDVATTLYVFASPALYERNDLVTWLGPVGFVFAKAILFGAIWAVASVVRRLQRAEFSYVLVAYCGALGLMGAYLTVWNLSLIVRTLV